MKKIPRKPRKLCSYPSCQEMTEGRLCERHTKVKINAKRRMTEILLYVVGVGMEELSFKLFQTDSKGYPYSDMVAHHVQVPWQSIFYQSWHER